MILQELVRYYDRRVTHPDPTRRLPLQGFEDKEIPFVIELGIDGAVVQMVDTRTLENSTPRARRFLVPQGVKKTSGIRANLLWDTFEYAIGLQRSKKDRKHADRTREAHVAFRARIEALPEAVRATPGIAAVLAALDRADWSALTRHPAWPEVVENNPVVAFRLAGTSDLVCENHALRGFAQDGEQEGPRGVCLVDGSEQALQRLHPVIKGVWRAQTSGANIVSFNARAFESYGKTDRQGENAPIGERAAFAYTTALNHLLLRESTNRVQVGDTSTVFWADGPAPVLDGEFSLADLLGDPGRDEPDRGVRAVQALYRAVRSGLAPGGDADVRFFVLGLAPNAARISVRFWIQTTVGELAPQILQHFGDLRIVRSGEGDPVVPSMFRLLASLGVQGKIDTVSPRLGGEWVRSILQGLPYPSTLLSAAVARCRSERDVPYLRAAIIKAWLNRHHRHSQPDSHSSTELFKENLDMNQQDGAYRLGRLFAVLERIQQRAQPGINATIRDRYYGAASTTPVTVFTTLLRLKNAHLKKLGDREAGWFEKQIGDLFGTVGEPAIMDFPRQLDLPGQGRFALGYYHQRQSFFTRRPDADTDEPSDNSKED